MRGRNGGGGEGHCRLAYTRSRARACVTRCRRRFSRIHKESCFLFQLGEKVNPELQIITSVFNKVIHRGEYVVARLRREGKTVKRLASFASFLNQAGNSVVLGSIA